MNQQAIKTFFIALVLLALIDAPYLYLNKKRFGDAVNKISNKPLTNRYYAGIIVYIALALGLTTFVNNKKMKASSAFMYGFLFGLVTYAVFDFTTHYMFQDWTLALSAMDTIWGGVLCGIVALVCNKTM